MKELDENYKRLIKARYALNNMNISNKEHLDREIKQMNIDRGLLIKIAEDISICINEWNDVEKTKPIFSHTTLGRIMGYYENNGEIKPSNLDRIAKYIGRQNWNDLMTVDPESVEMEILKKSVLAEDIIMSVMDNGENTTNSGLRRLLSHNLQKKQVVEVFYGKGRKLVLEKLSEAERFMIKYCDSDVLRKGCCISIPFFFVGVNVVGLDVRYNNIQIKAYYKSGGVITSIKVVNGMWKRPTPGKV